MKDKQGLGLVEVLIAIAILTIGVAAVMRLFPAALSQSRVAAQRTIAAEVARSEFAKVRSVSSEFLVRSGVYDFASYRRAAGSGGVTQVNAGNSNYTGYQGSLTRLSGAASCYLQRATFTVLTPEGNTEEFVTYITKQ